MPFARDTLSTLIDKTLGDIAARMAGANPYLRRSVLNVLGRVVAAQHHDEMGYLDWQARMAVPVTARGEFIDSWAALRGVYRKAAAYASGTITVSGGTPGVVIPALTELQSSVGTVYAVGDGATIDINGNASLTAGASVRGSVGNLDSGALLRFSTNIYGVPDTATVVTMTGGTDLESDDALLTRMLQVWAAPPQGGDLTDYQRWALEVPQVTRAWAGGVEVAGAGSVSVFFMCDDDDHTYGAPIGSNGVSQYEARGVATATGDQLEVADYIYPLRPVTALVYATAPLGMPLNITLAEVPLSTTIRADIATAVEGLLLREATPGGVRLPDLTMGGLVRRSHLEDAIAAVPDLDHFVLVSPTVDITVGIGEISIPGSISYL